MRSFEEIIKDCIDNRTNKKILEKYQELLTIQEIKNLEKEVKELNKKIPSIKKLYYFDKTTINEINIESFIWEVVKSCNFKNNPPKLYTFKNAVVEYIARYLFKNLTDEQRQEIKKYKQSKKADKENKNSLKFIPQVVSADQQKYANSEITIIDDVQSQDLTPDEVYEKESRRNEGQRRFREITLFKKDLEEMLEKKQGEHKFKDKDWLIYTMVCTCFGFHGHKYDGWQDLMTKLCEISLKKDMRETMKKLCFTDNLQEDWESTKINKNIKIVEKQRKDVENIIKHCKKHGTSLIKNLIKKRFTFSAYVELVNYFIELSKPKLKNSKLKAKKSSKPQSNNGNLKVKKLSMPELIVDFNKIRNYMSVLFMNKDINDKSSFVKESNLGKSSYEKDIRRILALFHRKGNKIFDIRENLEKYSPNKLSKIYDTHNVPNLIPNFIIIDILQKQEKPIKITDLMSELFRDSDYDDCGKDKKENFRKNILLPRLSELEEYGFITKIGNDKYLLTAEFLTPETKETLKYVVPFFCGVYPFSSIGHFLANRLNIEDIFEFEAFNVANVLDDSITFDLLTAIHNNEQINIVLKDKNNIDTIPKKLVIDKDNNLLKVVCGKNEYYLHEIDRINGNKPNNLIFSEIYSFYYKIFEEAVNEYKQKQICNINSIIEKYGSEDTQNNYNKIEDIWPKLASLDKVEVPLTKLELQWLKTIMQDVRFDLFVNEKDKKSLDKLVENVEPFNLSAFKIYDHKTKRYKCITDFGMSEGINKNTFRKQIKELKTVLFNINTNTFDLPETPSE